MKKVLLILCLLLSIVFVGCSNEETIKVYTRDTTSGTRDCFFSTIGFEEAVSDPNALVKGAMETENNDGMINYIKNDKNGIGYISLATLESSKLKGLNYEGVNPSTENVLNGTYKFKRNFNFIIRDNYENEKEEQIVKAFIAYLSTKEGKATIKSKDGIIDILSTDPTWESIKESYPIYKEDNSSITIKFGGSTSVMKMVKALAEEFSAKCGNFVVEQNHTGSGDAYKRTQGTEKDGANYLSIGFSSREFKATENGAEGTMGKMCIDAVVVVVNPENKITSITASTLKSIYNGSITSWNDVK